MLLIAFWIALVPVAFALPQSLPADDAQAFRQALDDFRSQRLKAAVEKLRRLASDHPGHFDVQHLLAITLDMSGLPSQANRHFERAVQIQPGSVQARINYGANLNRLGRWQQAVAQFKKSLELDPSSATARFNLGMIYLGQQRYQEALPWLSEAHRLQAEVYENGYQLAFCHFALGQHAQAARLLDSLDSAGASRGEFHLLKALNQKAAGHPAAERSLQEALDLVASSPSDHAQVASLLLSQGMFRQALPILQAAVQRFPESDQAWLDLARVEAALGEASAVESAKRALGLRETPQAHRLLGDLLDAGDSPQQAAVHYQKAVELDPGEESFYALGYFFLRHWNWETAEEVFAAGLEKTPAAHRLLLGLGAARLGQGDDSGATRAFLDASADSEAPLTALHLLAQSFARAPRHFDEAARRFERFYREAPQNPWAGYYFALAAFRRAERLGDFPDSAEALQALQKASEQAPEFFEAFWLLGEIHFHHREWESAVQALRQAVELNPEHVESRYKLALSLQRCGEAEQARSQLETYQMLKARHNEEAERRMSRTKKLIIEMGKPNGTP